MVVTLIAVEARGEKEVRRVFHRLRGEAEHLEVTRGGHFFVRAGRGENGVDELVIRHVVLHLRAHPVAKKFRAFAAEELAVHLEQVAPLVRPVIHGLLRYQQPFDQLLALPPRVPRIRDEPLDLLRRRRQPREVEINAAHKFEVRANARRERLHALQFRRDEFINAPVRRRRLPHEARAVAHHREHRAGIVAFITCQHRRLAAPLRREQAALVVLRDLRIPALDKRLRRHIAHQSVGKRRHHAKLLPPADPLHHRIDRREFDLRHPRRFEVQLHPARDPRAQDLIILVARLHHLTALMRDACRALEQNERLIRARDIGAPALHVVRECADVVDGIIAAQTQLEARLAVLRAVAGARVAPEARKHRRHIANIIRDEDPARPAHRHRRLRAHSAERGLQFPRAVALRRHNPRRGNLHAFRLPLHRPRRIRHRSVLHHRCHQQLRVSRRPA